MMGGIARIAWVAFAVIGVRENSIGRKLTGLVVTAVAVATLLSALATTWRETNRRFDAKREVLDGIAGTIGTAAAASVAANDRQGIAIALNSIRGFPSVRYVLALDADGNRLYDVGTGIVVGDARTELEANVAIGALTTLRLGTYLASKPITSGGRQVGRLVLIADVSELRFALLESTRDALVVGIIAALMAIAASARWQRTITAPITLLASAALDIRGSGDYTKTVPRIGDDEIGQLVDDFNGMMREIHARDNAIRRHRDHLADEVAARTCDLVRARDTADRANAAKSEFLATMSHEIRTPLNGMLVTAELMAEEAPTSRLQRQCGVIVRSGQTLLSLINDVLDLSKIEAGHLELEAVACDPGDVLDDVVGLFAGKAAAGGLELACRIAPDVPTSIITDPLRLRQILSNLVANALKFTEAGGVLVSLDMTETAGPGRHLRLTIADSGIGIPEDKIGQLFNPFTQADASTTRQFGGTGIGLTICRRLATAMGGRIEVSSVVGHGSTFAVTLPVTVAATREHCSKTDAYPRCAIVHSPGPYRDALMVLAARMQFDVVEPDALSNGDILFVGADLFARLASDETSRTLKRPHVVIVPRPSDTPAHIAAKHDGATRLLPPIGGRQSEAAIRRILSGVDQGDNGDALPRLTPAQDRASYSGRRVLAVDDNAINRELLAEALGRYGIAVISADSGAAALTCFEEGVFDLVFMDGSMPGMDGFETTRRIRAYERHQGGAETPIVALTANVLGQAADAWRTAGMSDYLAKPFTLATLDACLDRWLGAVANANPSSAVSSAPTVDTNQPLLDDSVLDMIASIQASGDNLVDRVVGMYIDHAPRMLEALLACAAGEPEEIGKAAHALKSLSRNIGAVAVGEHCEHIEAGAADGYRPTSKALQHAADAVVATTSLLVSRRAKAA